MAKDIFQICGVDHESTTTFEKLLLFPFVFIYFFGVTPIAVGVVRNQAPPDANLLLVIAIFAVLWFACLLAGARLIISIARVISSGLTFLLLLLVIFIQWQMRHALIEMVTGAFSGS